MNATTELWPWLAHTATCAPGAATYFGSQLWLAGYWSLTAYELETQLQIAMNLRKRAVRARLLRSLIDNDRLPLSLTATYPWLIVEADTIP